MYSRTQSEEDFAKARNKALFNEIQHFLTPEETRLLSLSEMKKLLMTMMKLWLLLVHNKLWIL